MAALSPYGRRVGPGKGPPRASGRDGSSALSLRMAITDKGARFRSRIGLDDREFIRDWVQGIVGADLGPL